MEHKSKPGRRPQTRRKSPTALGKSRLSSVANSLRLLKVFSDEDSEIGISALAQRLGWPRARCTVWPRRSSPRTCSSRIRTRADTGSAWHCWNWRAGAAQDGRFQRGQALPANVEGDDGETVHLAILDHASVFYVTKLESKQAIRMSSEVGARAPVHCTGDGKALLAFQPEDFVDEVIGYGLPERTPNTITDPKALRRDLAAIRARGYAIDNEESELGLRSVAATIRSRIRRGDRLAQHCRTGAADQQEDPGCARTRVVKAAEAISQRLGYGRCASRRYRAGHRHADCRRRRQLQGELRVETQDNARLLELRPHARIGRGADPADGIDLNYISMPVEETFFRMLRHREFEAAEMSLSSYTVSLFSKDKPFIAIPGVSIAFFPPFVHLRQRGERHPRTRRPGRQAVGNPEYQMTAPAWIRGIFPTSTASR